MKKQPCLWLAVVVICFWYRQLGAQEIAISYPGLTGESASLWQA